MEEKTSLRPLPPEALYRHSDNRALNFSSTAELDGLAESIGQARALEAVQFGIGIRRPGFNLYLLGPAGAGKYVFARNLLDKDASTQATPDDWIYVNNFATPETPRALNLPAGRGAALQEDMRRLVEDLRAAIPAAFQTENYQARKHAIEHEIGERQEKAFSEVQEEAGRQSVALVHTPTGLIFAPTTRRGDVISPDDFEKLPEAEHQEIEKKIEALQEKLQAVFLQAPKWEQERRERIRELNHEVAIFAAGHLIDQLKQKHADLPQVMSFLKETQEDIVENVDQFLMPADHPLAALMGALQLNGARGPAFVRRYQVNLLVDHQPGKGAPVVYEDHPTYQNLLGRVEYMAHMGALTTDFNLVRSGALHRANGGYLILDAYKVLTQPYAWEALKRSLQAAQLRIESLGEMLGLVSTVSLKPQPIPLNVKVVLVGERLLYYLLASVDPEFQELFKVAADFEEHVDRNGETERLYAQWIATVARQEQLLPLDAGAVGRIIEHSSRVAGDSQKVLALRRFIEDVLRESDHWARQASRAIVTVEDVQRTIDARVRRADRVRQRLLEETMRGTLLIDTDGDRIGQINGLSVLTLGDYSFGHPSRITARVRMGKGEVVDIEREVELSGPIHSKGVLILSGFLSGRYAPDHPLSLQASLVFEQSYSGVEGDSASSAELYAILSALSGLPIKQSIAVTGSVNQNGQVQAIGGVNEKIEGFFDLCRSRGLAGQGVLIPRANVTHLMLRQDVVEAVRDEKFRLYAIETIDQGIEILTGVPAGERDSAGRFPAETVNQKVEARLVTFAEKRIEAVRKSLPENGA